MKEAPAQGRLECKSNCRSRCYTEFPICHNGDDAASKHMGGTTAVDVGLTRGDLQGTIRAPTINI
jgi:hypothetical protein